MGFGLRCFTEPRYDAEAKRPGRLHIQSGRPRSELVRGGDQSHEVPTSATVAHDLVLGYTQN
jgi:hypothetical protein